LLAAPAAWCASGPPITYNAFKSSGKSAAEVRIADRPALRLYCTNASLTPLRRAEIVAGRLSDQQARGIGPSSYHPKKIGPQWWVMAASERLVCATSQEAAVRGVSPQSLARSWCESLKKLLSLPPLFVEPESICIPLGESRNVEIGGWGTGSIEVLVEGGLVTADSPGLGRTLTLSGRELGETVVEVKQGSLAVRLKVAVMLWAATLLEPQPALVTGNPTDSKSIKLAVQNAVSRSISLEDGASLELPESVQVESSPAGSVAKAIAWARGSGLLERKCELSIPLLRVDPPLGPPKVLLYCNEPERVERPQPLFFARLSCASRLFVHHQNASSRVLSLSLYLCNQSGSDATVHILGGDRAARGDVIGTGLGAGAEFLQNMLRKSGCEISLAPGSVDRIASMKMSPGAVASAVFDFTPIEGTGVTLTVAAESPDSTAAMGLGYHGGLAESDHVYAQTTRAVREEYTVGQKWAFIPIGRSVLETVNGRKSMRGDYGVVYHVDVDVVNPTAEPKRVVVRFEAAAGPAAAVMWVDGRKCQIGRLGSLEEATLASLTLPAESERTVRIETMPLGGSSYPARLIVRKE
jgi:hypothetical protein